MNKYIVKKNSRFGALFAGVSTVLTMLLLVFASAPQAFAAVGDPDNPEIMISEVSYLGDGTASNEDWVELTNLGTETVDITDYYLCAEFVYWQIGQLTTLNAADYNLEPGEVMVVQIPTDEDLNDAAGDMALYINNTNFGDAANMMDFVQYGTASDVGRVDVAVTKGIWEEPSTDVFEFVPVATGAETLQRIAASRTHYDAVNDPVSANVTDIWENGTASPDDYNTNFGPFIRIDEPLTGAEVNEGDAVSVEYFVIGHAIDGDPGPHLRVIVDETDLGAVYNPSGTVNINSLTAGTHTIELSLAQTDGTLINVSDMISVDIVALTATPTATVDTPPTATPATETPSETPTVAATATEEPTATVEATATATSEVPPTATPATDTPTETPEPPATGTPMTSTPTATGTPAGTAEPTWTATNTPTTVPTATNTVEATSTPTETPTETATPVPTETPTEEPTEEPTATPTETPTDEPTATPTDEPTATPTVDPDATATPTADPNATATSTPTITPTPQPFSDDSDGLDQDVECPEGTPDPDHSVDTCQDTDDDGIPDWADDDDEGDGLDTSQENPDPNNDGDDEDAQDTDEDGTPDYLDSDDDGNGVETIVEVNAPNNGDGNDDGTLDALQNNVVSLVSAESEEGEDDYITVVFTGDCDDLNVNGALTEGEVAEQDSEYDYPYGLVDYELTCGAAGQSGDVTMILHDLSDPTGLVIRKYGPTTPGGSESDWYDYSATFGTTTIDGKTVVTVTFTITDGVAGDDTAVDGVIYDPLGVAVLQDATPTPSPTPDPAATATPTPDTAATSTPTPVPATAVPTAVPTIVNPTAVPVVPNTGPQFSISKSSSASISRINGTLTYTITIQNTSGVALSGVTITDVLSPQLDFVSGSNGASYDPGSRTVSIPIGDMAVSQSATVTIDTRVNASASAGITINNTATVIGAGTTATDSNVAGVQVIPDALPETGYFKSWHLIVAGLLALALGTLGWSLMFGGAIVKLGREK